MNTQYQAPGNGLFPDINQQANPQPGNQPPLNDNIQPGVAYHPGIAPNNSPGYQQPVGPPGHVVNQLPQQVVQHQNPTQTQSGNAVTQNYDPATGEPVFTMTQSQLEQLVDQTTQRVRQNLDQPSISQRITPDPINLNKGVQSPTTVPEDDELTNLMWEDPQKFAEVIKQQAVNEISQSTKAQQEINEFWNNFYQQNPDLNRAQDHALAENILNQNMNTLGHLPLSNVIPQLGQMVRAQIANYATRFGGQMPQNQTTNQPASHQFIGEQPNPVAQSQATQPGVVTTTLPQPQSITGLIKAKNAARFNK